MLGPMIAAAFLTVLLAMGAGVGVEPGQSSDRVCLGVPTFQNASDWHDNEISFAAASELADRLFASGEFTIIGPADIGPVFEELEIEWMDPFNAQIISKVADRIGCPYVLAGRVAKFTVKSYSGGIRLVRAKIIRATATVA